MRSRLSVRRRVLESRRAEARATSQPTWPPPMTMMSYVSLATSLLGATTIKMEYLSTTNYYLKLIKWILATLSSSDLWESKKWGLWVFCEGSWVLRVGRAFCSGGGGGWRKGRGEEWARELRGGGEAASEAGERGFGCRQEAQAEQHCWLLSGVWATDERGCSNLVCR